MADAINIVGRPRLERSKHRLKYRKLLNCDMGQLIPIQCDLCIPGDVLRLNVDTVTRLQPLVAPILQQINLDTHTFFVPIRILDEDFADDENGSITGGVFRPGDPTKGADGLSTKTFPRWIPRVNPMLKYSLWDYFGHPLQQVAPPFPTDWHRRAYYKIYNDWYRPQQFEKELDITDLNQDKLKYRCFRKDYFTSAALYTQEGVAPSLPLTGQTEADFSNAPLSTYIANTLGIRNEGRYNPSNPAATALEAISNIQRDSSGSLVPIGTVAYLQGAGAGSPPSTPGPYIGSIYANEAPLVVPGPNVTGSWRGGQSFAGSGYASTGIYTNQDFINWLNNNTVDLSTVSTFDVNQLREIVQMHKYMERNSRIGLRYVEQLNGRWHIAPRDDRLQRPEYIGGTRTPIIISEVLQTSQTTQGTNSSPQGTLAGHGLSAAHGRTRKYLVKEWGYLITIMSIMPKVGYSQGIDRQYLYESRYDFPSPEFMHLSEREIYNTEIMTSNTEIQNRQVWGYRPMYDEHRLKHDMVCADMRDTLDYWHLNRQFPANTVPPLNYNFLTTEGNIRKDIFAVQNEPGFIVHAGIRLDMVRSLPKLGEPGLMDHF